MGIGDVTVSAFANLWSQLSSAVASSPNVMFGLMNEPQVASAVAYQTEVNSAIAAIRATGANQEVLVSLSDWGGSDTSWDALSNAQTLQALGGITDPINNYAYEVHQYFDPGSAGETTQIVSPNIGAESLAGITTWARQTDSKLFLGETGAGSDALSLTALQYELNFVQQNSDVWQGATCWAAGQVWDNYIYDVQPALGLISSPQMRILDEFSNATTTQTTLADGNVQITTSQNEGGGSTMVSTYTSNNQLLTIALFEANGACNRVLNANSDGTYTVFNFDGSDQALPGMINVYV